MNQAVRLSIVVGLQHAQKNVAEVVRAVAPALHPQVELLFCYTAADPDVPVLVGSQGQIRLISAPAGSLIPHLWRDGILVARGERVATTTAHCIPTEGWVEALSAADLDNAAYGGTIENDANADAKARAIFLLRYSAFAPPETKRDVRELAADNALYRRSDLLRHKDLLQCGFHHSTVDFTPRVSGSFSIRRCELCIATATVRASSLLNALRMDGSLD